jgi:hypothetical protein
VLALVGSSSVVLMATFYGWRAEHEMNIALALAGAALVILSLSGVAVALAGILL